MPRGSLPEQVEEEVENEDRMGNWLTLIHVENGC